MITFLVLMLALLVASYRASPKAGHGDDRASVETFNRSTVIVNRSDASNGDAAQLHQAPSRKHLKLT
jgi:hypothetical protein